MGNFKLYFYGLGARAVVFVGILILFYGFYIWYSQETLSIMIMVSGVGVIVFGKAMRFHYQRESGSIIHRGDW